LKNFKYMETTFWVVLWIAIGIIVVAGIIRLCYKHPKNFGEAFLDFLWLDIIFEIIIALIESLGD